MNSLLGSNIRYSVTTCIDSIGIRLNGLCENKYCSYLEPTWLKLAAAMNKKGHVFNFFTANEKILQNRPQDQLTMNEISQHNNALWHKA
jgi:hypothetical protein